MKVGNFYLVYALEGNNKDKSLYFIEIKEEQDCQIAWQHGLIYSGKEDDVLYKVSDDAINHEGSVNLFRSDLVFKLSKDEILNHIVVEKI